MDKGQFTIPTRVYLDEGRRAKLEQLLRQQARDLDELLSELLAAYLDAQPEPPAPADEHAAARGDELRQHRRELRRLRPYLHDPHNPPPGWLVAMVADLERAVGELERELHG